MEASGLIAVITGLFLRIGIPLGVTALMVWWLQRLDSRWQMEAQQSDRARSVHNSGCWKVQGCSPEKRASCKAYLDQDQPCWQVFRDKKDKLPERCLVCQVFRQAPIPV